MPDQQTTEGMPGYRDTTLHMVIIDHLEYAERLMSSFDILLNKGVIRDLDEQILGFSRSQDTMRAHLQSHRESDNQIPYAVFEDLIARFSKLTAHWSEECYPADMRQRHRAMIQETLQIFLSYRREALRLAV